jgi:opacity protein-like surface antigen
MKRSYLILLLIAVSMSVKISAQNNQFGFQYSVAITTGDLNDFIGKTSFRGLNFDYHHFLGEKIGLGFEFNWNNFYEEKAYDTYTDGTASISGKQYRYCLALPMLVSVKYFLKPGEKFNPYAGFGLGTQWTRNDVDMGLYTFYDNVWHFVLKPEIGIIYNPNTNFGITFSVKYFEAFKSGTIGERSYVTSNLGMAWTW